MNTNCAGTKARAETQTVYPEGECTNHDATLYFSKKVEKKSQFLNIIT